MRGLVAILKILFNWSCCWCEQDKPGHSEECRRNPTHLCHRHRTYYIEGWTR